MNKVILLGHLGNDPKLEMLKSGKSVCKFTVATNERNKDKNYTEWHNISVWGSSAEICNKYLKKGRQVLVEGQIKYRSFEGKDGNKKYYTEIMTTNVQFLDSKKSENNTNQPDLLDKEYKVDTNPGFTKDEIPF